MNQAIRAIILEILNDKPITETEYDDESDDDEVDVLRIIMNSDKETHVKISNYVEEVVDRYSDADFRSHFRLSRAAVQDLLEKLGGDHPLDVMGHPRVPKRHALLLSLYVLATQEAFRSTADRFGFERGHAFRLCMNIWKQMYDKSYLWINFPQGNATHRSVEKFQEFGFPGVIGIVDGSHIRIPGPLNDDSYFNRKKFHSVILQAVCDSDLRFVDVFCGFPGCAHDARVWSESPLGQELANNWQAMLPPDCHILGDKAYPSLNYLVVCFKDDGQLTPQMVAFNKLLSKVRVKIEHAFGRLKGIFTRLQYLRVRNLSYAKYYITAACILHNIVLEDRFHFGDLQFDMYQDPDVDNDDVNVNGLFGAGNVETGQEKRIRLMNALVGV